MTESKLSEQLHRAADAQRERENRAVVAGWLRRLAERIPPDDRYQRIRGRSKLNRSGRLEFVHTPMSDCSDDPTPVGVSAIHQTRGLRRHATRPVTAEPLDPAETGRWIRHQQQPGPRTVLPEEARALVKMFHPTAPCTLRERTLAHTAAVLGEQREAVLSLHAPYGSPALGGPWCEHCSGDMDPEEPYPCPTARALGVTG